AVLVCHGAIVCSPAAARRSSGRRPGKAGTGVDADTAGRRFGDSDLGQVLALSHRPVRIRGNESRTARAVSASPLAALPSRPAVLPHALHLLGNRVSLRPAVSRGAARDDGASTRAVPDTVRTSELPRSPARPG